MRYLGIDYGSKKIGIAVSSEDGKFAFAHSVILNKGLKKAATEIGKIAKENKIGKIVLGRSLNYKGEPNPIMEEIEKFKAELEGETGLEVIYENEVLTTMEAKRYMRGERVRPPVANKKKTTINVKKEKETIDASAAAIILRSFLEKNNV
ncbi:MAG: Holliday junction resolvase RuvX [Candidatus Azambacteria bacterium]|nr:Holliday junction resolvase RuvX [Candidatus Azambacteria bacterium]